MAPTSLSPDTFDDELPNDLHTLKDRIRRLNHLLASAMVENDILKDDNRHLKGKVTSLKRLLVPVN